MSAPVHGGNWYHFEFPETREALQLTADFLAEKVAR